MKRIIFLLAFAVTGIFVHTLAQTKNIYVYSASDDCVGTMEKVTRIEFSDNKLILVAESGESVSLDMSVFGYLTFTPKGTTGIEETNAPVLNVSIENGVIHVESSTAISSVCVFNAKGELTDKATPQSASATVNANAGLNIVVVDANGTKSIYKLAR